MLLQPRGKVSPFTAIEHVDGAVSAGERHRQSWDAVLMKVSTCSRGGR
jgi:hypothetical protein